MAVFYFVSPRIRRSLVYGKAPRNRLDLYLPPAKARAGGLADAVPVVVYITGALAAPPPCPQGCTQTKLRTRAHEEHFCILLLTYLQLTCNTCSALVGSAGPCSVRAGCLLLAAVVAVQPAGAR